MRTWQIHLLFLQLILVCVTPTALAEDAKESCVFQSYLQEHVVEVGPAYIASSSWLEGSELNKERINYGGVSAHVGLQFGAIGAHVEALGVTLIADGATNLDDAQMTASNIYGRWAIQVADPLELAFIAGYTASSESSVGQESAWIYESKTQGIVGGLQAALHINDKNALLVNLRQAPSLSREHTRSYLQESVLTKDKVGPYKAVNSSWGFSYVRRLLPSRLSITTSYMHVAARIPEQVANLQVSQSNTESETQVWVAAGSQVDNRLSIAFMYQY